MARFGLLMSLALIVLLALPSAAQITDVTNTTSTPIPGAGHDYIKMLSETVNPVNGSVSLRIQVPTAPGRRLSLPFAFAYDSNSAAHLASLNDGNGGISWFDNTSYLGKGGWSYSVPVLSNYRNYEALAGKSGHCMYYSNYVFQDETGGRHSLYLSTDEVGMSPYCPSATPIIPVQKLTGGDVYYQAAITAANAPLVIADADGTVYTVPNAGQLLHLNGFTSDGISGDYASLVSSVEDRNGNIITVQDLNSQHAGSFSATDTLGRTILSSSGFGSSGDTITVSGLPSPYTVIWGTTSGNKAVGSVLIQQNDPAGCQSIPPLGGGSVMTQISLPNGSAYKFSYDATYGLLNKITYPDGGYVSYTYTLNPLSEFEVFPGESGTLYGCYWHHDTPAVLTRTVSFDGSTAALQQTFTYNNPPTVWSSSPWYWSSKKTTVTTTDNVSGLTYTTEYTYSPYVAPRQPNDFSQYQPQLPVEQTIVSKNSAGTILRTVTKVWLNQFELQSQQTMLEDNATTSKTTYTYGPGAQVTEQDDYDWPPTTPPLLRKTVTNYQPFASTPVYASGASIFDRPCQSIVYDGSGNRMAETDYFYDNGATTTVCGTAGTPSVADVTGLPAGTHDETNYAASSTQPRGNVTNKTHKCFVGTTTCTDSVSAYTYDKTGQVLSMTDPCGNGTCSDMATGSHLTTYFYNDNYTVLSGGVNIPYTPGSTTDALLTKITDPLGHSATFSYDFYSSQLTASTDANTQTTKYLYTDSVGNPEKLARLGESDYPDGGKTTVVYNDTPLSASVTQTTLIDPNANPVVNLTTVALLDGVGHVTQSQLTTDPDGTDYTDTTFDGQGHVWKKSNAHRSGAATTDGTTAFTFDALGRTTQVIEPDGSPVSTSYSLNQTTVTDEVRNQRTTQTDALGRLTYVWESPFVSGVNYETDYKYDALGNLLCAVQKGTDTTQFTTCAAAPAAWRARSFTYDSFSRLLSATNPESGQITYTYDLNSNVATKLAPKAGQTGTAQTTTNYSYDLVNRLLKKSYLNPNTGTVAYGYDGTAPSGCTGPSVPSITSPTNRIGRRSAMCSDHSASAWSYDAMGRTIVDARANKGSVAKTYTTSYAYYKDGSLNTLTYPSGDLLTYLVKGAGRPVQATDATNNYAKSVTYAPHGALTSMTNGTGIVTSNIYNDRLQPILLSAAVSPNPAFFSLCYDFHLGVAINSAPCSIGATNPPTDNGNVDRILNNGDSTRSQIFAYDSLNRISQANTITTTGANCWDETYTIDPWGNLTNRSGVSGMTGCGTEPLNAAPASTKNQLPSPVLYDAAGNVSNDGNGNSPTYDTENRISTDAGVTYYYDADGTRIEKSSGTMYWPGPGGNLTESDLSGTINEEYVFFDGARIARVDRPSGSVHYYFSDQLGSATVITGPSGAVQEQYFYYPYGGMFASIGSDPNRYKFTGKERDSESGLDMFGARYYGSSLGRFMTPDWEAKPTAVPYANYGNPQSLNLDSYLENNPTSDRDPDGHGDTQVILDRAAKDCREQGKCASGRDVLFLAGAMSLAVGGEAAWSSVFLRNLVGLGLATAPRTVPLINEALEGLTPGKNATLGRAGALGVSSIEKLGESGFVGTLENGARISAGFEKVGDALGVNISNIQSAARGSINFKALESGAANIAKSEGASSVTITAVNVTNSKLAQTLEKAGYAVSKVTDNFGRTTVNYVKKICTASGGCQ